MNILICLTKMDIGGVQTVVVNQIKKMLELKCNVVVLAKEGIYSNEIKKMGATFIDFDFKLCHRI